MHAQSLKNHIEHLKDSHRLLENQLHELEVAHQDDSLAAHEIKKKKLKLKDEIERCNQQLAVHLYGMPNHA
jgi:hypothetical protein